MKLELIGNYRYGSAKIGATRYAVIWNGDAVERVRKITPSGNPIIWEAGNAMTVEALAIINQANTTPC